MHNIYFYSCKLFPPCFFHFSIWLTFQQVALEHGLILVDTKYEFGKANDGSIMLIDEVQCYPWWMMHSVFSHALTDYVYKCDNFFFPNSRSILLIQVDIGLPILTWSAFKMVLSLKILTRYFMCINLSFLLKVRCVFLASVQI